MEDCFDSFDSFDSFDDFDSCNTSPNALVSNEELLAFLTVSLPDLLFDKVGYVSFYLSGYYANTYGTLDNYPDYLIADNFVINDRTKDDMRSKSLALQTNFRDGWSKGQYDEPLCFFKSKIGRDSDLQNYLSEVAKQVDELSWASLVSTVKGFDCYIDCQRGFIPFIKQETIKLDFNVYYDF